MRDRAVAGFTSRVITHDADRLPASTGDAQEIARLTGYQYKAGPWAEGIHEDLLWTYKGGATKNDTYTTPSWSWQSLKSAGNGTNGTKSCYAFRQPLTRWPKRHESTPLLKYWRAHSSIQPTILASENLSTKEVGTLLAVMFYDADATRGGRRRLSPPLSL